MTSWHVESGARVLEIRSAETQADLCRRYPLEVSAYMRGSWWETTCRDGRWVIPDWSRVAERYDAAHLHVAAYLEAAGDAVSIDGDVASLIAGWDPDATVWFTPAVLTRAVMGDWIRKEDGEWGRVD